MRDMLSDTILFGGLKQVKFLEKAITYITLITGKMMIDLKILSVLSMVNMLVCTIKELSLQFVISVRNFSLDKITEKGIRTISVLINVIPVFQNLSKQETSNLMRGN